MTYSDGDHPCFLCMFELLQQATHTHMGCMLCCSKLVEPQCVSMTGDRSEGVVHMAGKVLAFVLCLMSDAWREIAGPKNFFPDLNIYPDAFPNERRNDTRKAWLVIHNAKDLGEKFFDVHVSTFGTH